MENASLSRFVVLYWVPEGCIIAEVDGATVCQFGPFEQSAQPLTLASSMFPGMPAVTLKDQAAVLDDEAVLILGNRASQLATASA